MFASETIVPFGAARCKRFVRHSNARTELTGSCKYLVEMRLNSLPKVPAATSIQAEHDEKKTRVTPRTSTPASQPK